MNTESKTYTKDLAPGMWIVWEGETYAVLATHNYANGWWVIDLTDGRSVDALGYASWVTV